MDAAKSSPARRSIITRFVDFVWTCIKWCFVLVLVAAVGGGYYYYHRLNDDIRSHAEQLLAEAYPDYEVEIGSARLVEGEGIQIFDVSLRVPGQPDPWGEVVHVRRKSWSTCPTEAESYLRGEFMVQHLLLRRPVLRATRTADGTWNTARLLPLPQLGAPDAPKPTAEIVNGTLEVLDNSQSPAGAITLKGVQCTLTPETPLPGHREGHIQVVGSATCEHFQRFEVRGFINPAQPECNLSGTLAGIQLTPALWGHTAGRIDRNRQRFGRPARSQRRTLLSHSGRRPRTADGVLGFGHAYPGSLAGSPLHVSAQRSRSTLHGRQPRLADRGTHRPQSTGHVAAGHVDRWLRRHQPVADGRSRASVAARFRPAGRPARRYAGNLAQVFPPAGTVHADLRLAFDGANYHPELALECLGTSFAYYKFPYRMTNTTGMLRLVGNRLTADLISHAGATPLAIKGELVNPSTAPQGVVTMVSDGAVAIDENMLAVLNENGQKFMRALRPQGGVLVDYRLEYGGIANQPPEHHLVMNVQNGSLNHTAFPYPVDRVTGVVEFHEGRWTFHDFQGRKRTVPCSIGRASGFSAPGSDTGVLHIDLVATDLPLEDELRDALSPKIADVWTEIRPRGTIDRVRLSLDYELPAQHMTVEVQAQKWPRPAGGEPGSISIEPVWLPYRIDNLTGNLSYRNGRLELTEIRGKHGTVSLTAAGFCQSEPEGGWRVRLEPLTIDCLQFDRDTLSSLPGQLSAAVDKIALTGPLNIAGAMEWRSAGPAAARAHELANCGWICPTPA